MTRATTQNRPIAKARPASRALIFLGLYAALTAWILLGGEITPEPLFAGVKNGGYAILLIAGIWIFRDGFARSWRTTRQHPLRAGAMILLGLALMGTASAVSYAVSVFIAVPAAGENQAAISAEVLAASTSLASGLLFLAIGGLAAPIVEELAFREIPFSGLRSLLSTRMAFVLSCAVFGAIHLRGLEEWPLAILYVGFSAALATAYLLSGRNLLVSVTAHVLWNGTGLAYLLITAP